jgi:hypothetical protein
VLSSPYWGRIETTTTSIDVCGDAPEIRESSVVEVVISGFSVPTRFRAVKPMRESPVRDRSIV